MTGFESETLSIRFSISPGLLLVPRSHPRSPGCKIDWCGEDGSVLETGESEQESCAAKSAFTTYPPASERFVAPKPLDDREAWVACSISLLSSRRLRGLKSEILSIWFSISPGLLLVPRSHPRPPTHGLDLFKSTREESLLDSLADLEDPEHNDHHVG
jgi:hypothetical protein